MAKHKNSKLEREGLLILLQNSSNLRIGQDQVIWSIFGAFWGTNALLLISLFAVNVETWNIEQVGLIISIIGILISAIWIIIEIRAINRIEMYEESIKYVEDVLNFPEPLRTFTRIPKETLWIKVKARTVMRLCCWFVMAIWLISLFYFTWLIFK